ncbi:CBS domain-containing protein [uncultured Gilvimarinus sp.]|uniref:CBS domain-containing protein n=1 Tax=uncultured Gilvimarinus sp. TaxID=1689143 RepID=UPI0030ED584F|tara:strand:- start:524 stop:946 length:423 start_codon:yes stop_codon:yes gene_type:complete
MKVQDVMTEKPEYLDVNASIREAALGMRDSGRGFTPVADHEKIVGIVTDRDIAVRAMADGKSSDDKVGSITSGKVLYCYQEDQLADVLQNMQDQQVQRLVVLNNSRNKDFVGVVSLADIASHCTTDDLSRRVVNACRHYH